MLGKRRATAVDEEEVKAEDIPLTKQSLAAINDTLSEYSYDGGADLIENEF
jgi:hypothetical protein